MPSRFETKSRSALSGLQGGLSAGVRSTAASTSAQLSQIAFSRISSRFRASGLDSRILSKRSCSSPRSVPYSSRNGIDADQASRCRSKASVKSGGQPLKSIASIAPDLPAELSSKDYRENRDPAIEAVYGYIGKE